MRRKQYSIEVEADPITVDLDEFDEDDILDYVENVLEYSVSENRPSLNVLDEVAEQLKDEFFEGLDFHQLNRLVRNKDKIVELLTVLP
jgi:hypothetical protein